MRSFHTKEGSEEDLIIQKPVFIVWNEKNWVARMILLLYKKLWNLKLMFHQCCHFYQPKIYKFRPSIYYHIFFQGTRGVLSVFSFCNSSTDWDSLPFRLYSHIWIFLNEGNEAWGLLCFPKNSVREQRNCNLGYDAYANTSVNSFIAPWSWGMYISPVDILFDKFWKA